MNEVRHEINKFIIILNSQKLKRNNIQYQHFLKIHAGRYEDIAMYPEKELRDISDYFKLTLLEDAESFLQEHASAKWHEKNRYQQSLAKALMNNCTFRSWKSRPGRLLESIVGDKFQERSRKRHYAKEEQELTEVGKRCKPKTNQQTI